MPKPIDGRPENSLDEEQGATSPCQCIFWDFNGTLLDDRDYAIDVRNRVFPKYGLSTITLEEYYQQFTFPVKLYYQRAGVQEESFVEVAHAWMDEYVRGCGAIPLHGDAVDTIETFQRAGIPQVVLSASKEDILRDQLAQYGVLDSFQAVLGLSHIYATSKQGLGQAYLEAQGLEAGRCVLLGDSLHDGEVAREMGIHCILIARGHQSPSTLREAGVPVVNNLLEAADKVLSGEVFFTTRYEAGGEALG